MSNRLNSQFEQNRADAIEKDLFKEIVSINVIEGFNCNHHDDEDNDVSLIMTSAWNH